MNAWPTDSLPGPWQNVLTMETTHSPDLEPAFFDRPADIVARDLLGKTLVRLIRGKRIALSVTETEAYLGPHDLASGADAADRRDVRACRHTLYLLRLRSSLDAECRHWPGRLSRRRAHPRSGRDIRAREADARHQWQVERPDGRSGIGTMVRERQVARKDHCNTAHRRRLRRPSVV